MEVLSAFTGVLHVPNLSQPEHVMTVLEESDAFTKRDLAKIQHDLRGAKYGDFLVCFYILLRASGEIFQQEHQ